MRSRYYDRAGDPISVLEWIVHLDDFEYRRVAWDELPGGGSLSTVWMGLDHSFGRGPPLIFETMEFAGHGHVYQEHGRWATLAEALEGHAAALAGLLRSKDSNASN